MSDRPQYDQLDTLEQTLLQRLQEVLPEVANGGNTTFFLAPDLNPWPEIAPPPVTYELTDLADQILTLRRELEEPVEGTPAALFLGACRIACDASDHQRKGPKRLARDLLDALPPL